MKKKSLIPQSISTIRLATLPLILYFFITGAQVWCLLVFGIAIVTDLIDGYIARKLNAATKWGAYFDATIDFTFIIGIFIAFIIKGYYPAWIMLLIVLSFGQFIISSRYSKKIYDPLGKYIGSVLYIAIALTLISPINVIFTLVKVAFPVFIAASFASRMTPSTINYRKNILAHKNKLDILKRAKFRPRS